MVEVTGIVLMRTSLRLFERSGRSRQALRERFPCRDTYDLTDEAIKREVLNTVGKAGRQAWQARPLRRDPLQAGRGAGSYLPDFLVRARVADGDTPPASRSDCY